MNPRLRDLPLLLLMLAWMTILRVSSRTRLQWSLIRLKMTMMSCRVKVWRGIRRQEKWLKQHRRIQH